MAKRIAICSALMLSTMVAFGPGFAQSALPASAGHSDAPGIDWFDGDVEPEVLATLKLKPASLSAAECRRLAKLDESLRQWGAAQHATTDIRALHARMSVMCMRLPSEDSGLASCQRFLRGAG